MPFLSRKLSTRRILTALSVVILLYFALVPFTVDLSLRDDLLYANSHASLQYMLERYMTWSSRIFIDYLAVVFSQNHLLFSIVNALLFLTTPLLIHLVLRKYCTHEYPAKLSLLICFAVFFLFPVRFLFSAGYIATTLNYLFPCYFMLLAFVLTHCLSDRHNMWTGIAAYALAVVCAIIACNQELGAILTVLLCALALSMGGKRKTLIMFLVIGLLSFASTMLSPGNELRMNEELTKWIPDYDQWSIIYKGYMGSMATLSHCFLTPNSILVFALMILLYARTARYSLALSGGIVLFIVQKATLLLTMNGHKDRFYFGTNFGLDLGGGVGLLLVAVIAAVFVWLWFNLDIPARGKIILGGVVLCACADRAAMGFSPTLFASSERTFVFFDFIMIMVTTVAGLLSKRVKPRAFSCILLTVVLMQFALQSRQMLMQLSGT